jgi:hypothetical protein
MTLLLLRLRSKRKQIDSIKYAIMALCLIENNLLFNSMKITYYSTVLRLGFLSILLDKKQKIKM